ncbi:MAG: bifunctional oligoribonuclease/PAP phosphatase NrnA [Anaerolineaceae bacterium]
MKIDQQIREAIATNTTFVVVSHIRPDGDAIGSALGLAQALRIAGKQVAVVLEDAVAEKYASLPGSGQVVKQLPNDYDYLIVVDCSDPQRTGSVLKGLQPDLVIDHHKTNLNFGKINLVEDEAEATALMLAKHIQNWGLSIDSGVASAFLTGILADTIGFRTSNVTSEALRVSAELVDQGANLHEIYYQTLVTRSLAEARYWGQGLTKLQYQDGLLWSELTLEDRIRAGYYENDDADLVNTLSAISDVQITVLFVQQSIDRVKISWRSVAGLDVSGLAFQFGGGGHAAAAGADVSGSLEEVRERILSTTRTYLNEKNPSIN